MQNTQVYGHPGLQGGGVDPGVSGLKQEPQPAPTMAGMQGQPGPDWGVGHGQQQMVGLPQQGMPLQRQPQPGDWQGDVAGLAKVPKKGGHRRSASDSFPLMAGRGRGGYQPSSSNSGAGDDVEGGDLASLNDDQLFSMFMDVDSLNALGTLEGGGEGSSSGGHVTPGSMTPSASNASLSEMDEMGADGDEDPNLLDPKRAKRILANRQSAQRSRMRKLQYISELERSVSKLHQEVASLTPQAAFMRSKHATLVAQNAELRQRIASALGESQRKDALNERLRDEVRRVKTGGASS